MNVEVLRIVDAIHRQKGIDKNLIFESIEQALAAAMRKQLNMKEIPVVRIDREKGDITAFDGDQPIETAMLGCEVASLLWSATASQSVCHQLRLADGELVKRCRLFCGADFRPRPRITRVVGHIG